MIFLAGQAAYSLTSQQQQCGWRSFSICQRFSFDTNVTKIWDSIPSVQVHSVLHREAHTAERGEQNTKQILYNAQYYWEIDTSGAVIKTIEQT